MKNYMQDYSIDVNTRLLDTYLDKLDNYAYQFDDTYGSIVAEFKDQLLKAECQEDVHDDLVFEIQVYSERYDYSIDIDEMATQIYKDFGLKGAE